VDMLTGMSEIEAAFEAWDHAVTSELFATPAVSADVVNRG